jgi:hypothetical protein
MAKIFISYRRRYNAYVADSLSEKLRLHFGDDSVFYDIDNIPLGVDFREHIGNAVGQCDVLLAVIGEEWVMAADKQGNKRLDSPTDSVRIEIESALNRKIPVIPVLVEEAEMPLAADLPKSIQDIVYRNAAELRAGTDFRNHIERLINSLDLYFNSAKKPKTDPVKKEPAAKRKPAARKKARAQPKAKVQETITSPPPTVATPPPPTVTAPPKTFGRNEAQALIIQILGGLADEHVFLAGSIPDIKLNNALRAYAPGVDPAEVLLLYDNTVFGSAKDGLLITLEAVYWHNMWENIGLARFSDIKTVSYNVQSLTSQINVDGSGISITQSNDLGRLTKILADLILNLSQSVRGFAWEDAKPVGNQTTVVSNDNTCQLSIPEDWVKRTELHSQGIVQVAKSGEDLYVIIIREPRSDFPETANLKTYVDLVCNNPSRTLKNPEFFTFIPSAVAGFPATQFEMSGFSGEVKYTFLFLCVETPKNFYQILGWTRTDFFPARKPELQSVIYTFKEI